ncbi:MAG: hypothetical protein NTW00_17785 [Hyphomicrobiales bacterium]|nr:hypothetical protein [Hyphomicrobiales bacterium]
MVDLIKSTAPSAFGAAVAWYEAALSGLKGATTFAFEGSATAYREFMQGRFADITDPALRQIATRFASGEAIQGGMQNDGFAGSEIADVMVGGKGDDVLVGAGGSGIYVYARGDGGTVNLPNGGRTKTGRFPLALRSDAQFGDFAPRDHRLGTKRAIVR